eukprot:TRINITY_DN64439_c0_g1_i1.p1 TRINITY_DN64439_c0_g1~~TRINITY_DN64439_c0_g1_i1.p1  ORF type:complete len:381 (+),score=32.09 TRINITY_DN64439_c0_g1_i1:159-1145(+)
MTNPYLNPLDSYPDRERDLERLIADVYDAWHNVLGAENVKVLKSAEEALATIHEIPKRIDTCPSRPRWEPTCKVEADSPSDLQCPNGMMSIENLGATFFHATQVRHALDPNTWSEIRYNGSLDICTGPAFFMATEIGWWNNPGYLRGAGYGKTYDVVFEIGFNTDCMGAIVDDAGWKAIRDHDVRPPGLEWLMLNWLSEGDAVDVAPGKLEWTIHDSQELRIFPAASVCEPRIKKVYILKYATSADHTMWLDYDFEGITEAADYVDARIAEQASAGCTSSEDNLRPWSSLCGWEGNTKTEKCGHECCTVPVERHDPACFPAFAPNMSI